MTTTLHVAQANLYGISNQVSLYSQVVLLRGAIDEVKVA
jgi:hypothetical protein